MPYVSIKITGEPKATPEQREQLIGLVTDALVVTLDKDPESTFVVIEEIGTDSWGLGGETFASRRARSKRKPAVSDDAPGVVDVVRSYFDGIHRGDVGLLREVFHPEARLVGFAPSDPKDRDLPDAAGWRTLDEYLRAVASRVSPRDLGEPMASRILSVRCERPIASVRAYVPMLGYSYTDHLMLVREGGRWRITHKQFAHCVSKYGHP